MEIPKIETEIEKKKGDINGQNDYRPLKITRLEISR